MGQHDTSAADLTAALLNEEAARLEAEQAEQALTVRADEELPGVGEKQMSLQMSRSA